MAGRLDGSASSRHDVFVGQIRATQSQRLWGVVTGLAAATTAVLLWALSSLPPGWQVGWHAILLATYIAALHASEIRIRIRSTGRATAPASAALLLCVAYSPPAEALLIVASGALLGRLIVGRLIIRQEPIKVVFNASKETLAVAGAAAVTWYFGFVPAVSDASREPLRDAWILALAAVAYAVLDDLLFLPVMTITSGKPAHYFLLSNLDIRLGLRLGGLVAAFVTFQIAARDPRFLLVLPLLVYGLHLASLIRVRARAERETWQRLAEATDEFTSVDLDSVLRTAVTRAADLFSVHEVEVEVNLPPRLVRGDSAGIRYDGRPADAPPADGQAIVTDLTPPVDSVSLGELRLLVRGGQITLSERENYTLSTYAAALCTAIRNANTFAETKRLAEINARAAAIDPLTGLANRRRLQEYAGPILAAKPPTGFTALLLIDLNHFKEINDTLGHSAGDQVLVEAGFRLAATAQPDDLVARLGGDEFAILLVGLPTSALAVSRAHALLASLSPPMVVDGVRVSIEACGGVATTTDDGKSGIEELLRRADVAMYQAKRSGQRVVVYSQCRDTADVNSLALAGDLARAIADGEFVVRFQPIVDLGSGEIIGAEALTRWHHPQRGDLAPDRFLDAVERSGQLSAFVAAVLDQALTADAAWRDAGFDIPVSVNVSPRSLLDPEFPTVVEARLNAKGLPAANLVVELTESVTLSQLEVVDDALGKLRDLGVRLSLDDFGTGFSSLATLARVPVHELKIDRAFIAALEAPTEAAVVRSTIELGRSLGLIVVAEGVESERQRNRLWELGCPFGQGHLFARPAPPERVLELLVEGVDGRPGRLAAPLHEAGAVIRIPPSRRARGQQAADG
jgi:diguanylate cyclase